MGRKKSSFPVRNRLIGRSGQDIPVQMSAAVIFKENREDGLVCFLRDLREIRKLEREMADQARILQQDKMMSLGRLAASVAHEINNPLTGVLNYVRLMRRMLQRGPVKGDQQEKFASHLELVEKETDRCSQIVSSLLTFSRKSAAEFVSVSVAELLRRSILLSRHKMDLTRIRLIHTPPEGLPDIRGDFNQLQQCLLNLIFNAIDAMPRGGDLTLSAAPEPGGGWVAITVSDTGTGIDEADLPRIFEPFFTTKAEGYGVGFGFSTIYGIVELHGEKIDVASQKVRGTTFTLTLPVFQKHA